MSCVRLRKSLRRPLERARRAGRDDLRELEQLDHRLALGDALRAEGHVDVEPEPRDEPLDHRGDARVHGAAQHEQLAVDEARRRCRRSRAGTALRSGLRCSSIGVPITITTCSASPITPGVARRPSSRSRRHDGAGPRGAGLVERHGAVVDDGDRGLVHVVERDVETPARERQTRAGGRRGRSRRRSRRRTTRSWRAGSFVHEARMVTEGGVRGQYRDHELRGVTR